MTNKMFKHSDFVTICHVGEKTNRCNLQYYYMHICIFIVNLLFSRKTKNAADQSIINKYSLNLIIFLGKKNKGASRRAQNTRILQTYTTLLEMTAEFFLRSLETPYTTATHRTVVVWIHAWEAHSSSQARRGALHGGSTRQHHKVPTPGRTRREASRSPGASPPHPAARATNKMRRYSVADAPPPSYGPRGSLVVHSPPHTGPGRGCPA